MKILAIDPGERVGWATATVETFKALEPEEHQLHVTDHGISYWPDFCKALRGSFGDYDVVIFEEYRISAEPRKLKSHIGSDVPTLQCIGIIRGESWQHPGTKLIKRSPAGKSTALKTVHQHPQIKDILEKLPSSHDDSHNGDALLHLWGWFFKEYA